MNRLTKEQRVKIVEFYYGNGRLTQNTFRKVCECDIFDSNNRPTEQTIQAIINKFETTYSVVDSPPRQRSARSSVNIPTVSTRVNENQHLSMLENLYSSPYEIQLTQEFKPRDHLQRRKFAEFALEQLNADRFFYREMLFSGEANFWLNGFVDKQNCRIWSKNKPHNYHEVSSSPKLTVWCAFHAGGIIGHLETSKMKLMNMFQSMEFDTEPC